MARYYYDVRKQALANCRFLYGKKVEIITTSSSNGFQVIAMACRPADVENTWSIALQGENFHTSLKLALEAFHEISASHVLERLCSQSVHRCSDLEWSHVATVRDAMAHFTGFQENELNSDGKKRLGEIITDDATDSKVADQISSKGNLCENVIADSPVEENKIGGGEHDHGVFVMPEPAVELSEDAMLAEKAKDGVASEANSLFSSRSPFKNPSRKKKGKKSQKKAPVPFRCDWGSPVSEDPVGEPAPSSWFDAAAIEVSPSLSAPSRNPNGEPTKDIFSASPRIQSPADEVLPAIMKQFKSGKTKSGKIFSSDCSRPDIEDSLLKHDVPVADGDWKHLVSGSELGKSFSDTPKQGDSQIPSQGDKMAREADVSSGWPSLKPSSLGEPVASSAAWNMSGKNCKDESHVTEPVPATTDSRETDYQGSVYTFSVTSQEQTAYDVYLRVKWDHGTFRLLAELQWNTKRCILAAVRGYFKVEINRQGRYPEPDFYIESAATDNGPIDTTLLGDGDWTKRLKFFASHTKSGLPELSINGCT